MGFYLELNGLRLFQRLWEKCCVYCICHHVTGHNSSRLAKVAGIPCNVDKALMLSKTYECAVCFIESTVANLTVVFLSSVWWGPWWAVPGITSVYVRIRKSQMSRGGVWRDVGLDNLFPCRYSKLPSSKHINLILRSPKEKQKYNIVLTSY